MKWSTKQRYRTYDSYSENDLQSLRKLALKSPWKSNFHIEPETGLLNDPNGFSYFNGKWHLFYQHFPFGPVHGLKSWVHLVSDDLVHFEKTGLVLYPDTKYDNAGAYSGSALAFENSLFLIYTGNHRGKDWVRTPYQLGAKVDKNNQLVKFTEPLIFPDFSQTTDHFRDPQIFSFQGQIYCLIGAQSSQKNGIIKLYKAIENNLTDWKDLGNLDFSKEKMGYMIECPNLIFVNGRSVLVFCPQGLDKSIVKYDNIYPNMYVIADGFTIGSKNQLKNAGQLINLDEGFDCYATQSFNAPDGSAYAISWLGLPETSYPTDKYNVQGVLSMVKKLSIKDNKLYQYPVEKMKELRQKEQDLLLADNNIITSNSYELEVDFRQQNSTLLSLMTNEKGDSALKVEIDKENNIITLIRNYEKRLVHVKIEKMNVFIDQSIFEIFINDGEKVLSGRVFPDKNQYSIRSQNPIKIKLWELKK